MRLWCSVINLARVSECQALSYNRNQQETTAQSESVSCYATMTIKVTLAAAVASLLLMQLSCCNASEDEGVELEEHKPLETSAVWGYSFLFNFLGCLPSACAIVVCLWAKVTIADKIITNLMAFASGVSVTYDHVVQYHTAFAHIFTKHAQHKPQNCRYS